jgi:hypothetical protein
MRDRYVIRRVKLRQVRSWFFGCTWQIWDVRKSTPWARPVPKAVAENFAGQMNALQQKADADAARWLKEFDEITKGL